MGERDSGTEDFGASFEGRGQGLCAVIGWAAAVIGHRQEGRFCTDDQAGGELRGIRMAAAVDQALFVEQEQVDLFLLIDRCQVLLA